MEERFLGFKLRFEDNIVNVFNVYDPSVESERYTFFYSLRQLVGLCSDLNLLL